MDVACAITYPCQIWAHTHACSHTRQHTHSTHSPSFAPFHSHLQCIACLLPLIFNPTWRYTCCAHLITSQHPNSLVSPFSLAIILRHIHSRDHLHFDCFQRLSDCDTMPSLVGTCSVSPSPSVSIHGFMPSCFEGCRRSVA